MHRVVNINRLQTNVLDLMDIILILALFYNVVSPTELLFYLFLVVVIFPKKEKGLLNVVDIRLHFADVRDTNKCGCDESFLIQLL